MKRIPAPYPRPLPALAERVRWLRLQHGISRDTAAVRSGVSSGWLSSLEQGRILHPSPDKLMLLAPALGTSYEDLMNAVGYSAPLPLAPEIRELALVLMALDQDERDRICRMVYAFMRPRRPVPVLEPAKWIS